jgi:hypothetical protein
MLTPCVARRISLTLGWIAGGNQAVCDFAGKKILCVRDLLELPPVVQNRGIPAVGRLITRIPYWPHIHTYRFTTPQRSKSMELTDFLTQRAKGSLGDLKTWAELAESLHVTVTQSPDAAQNFLCDGLEITQPFPVDRLWISPTNRVIDQINQKL